LCPLLGTVKTMNVRLNLSTKPLETHRRFLAGSGFVSAVALIIFFTLGWHVYLARKANAEMRARMNSIARQVAELTRQRAALEEFFALSENAKLHDRAAFINSLIDARSFNWTHMFMDLEDLLPAGVRVVSIEPKQDKGLVEVKLTIGATNNDAKLKFLKALEESKTFTDIRVFAVRESEKINSDPILVELTAEYSRT
jgi:type IV pilus assembly protein PilN